MRVNSGVSAAAVLGLTIAMAMGILAQEPPPASPPAPAARGAGGLVPGQKRAAGDPAQIARGKTIYEISCRGCHGADLRGGDIGGPNLLRSQIALSDRDGELIIPIIQGSRQDAGMPAIPMSPADAKAVSVYVRSVVATIGRQGMPPSVGRAAPSVLVGDASAGKAYFTSKCGSCHSATGDLEGIAKKIPDPRLLQNAFVAGARRSGREGPPPPTPAGATVRTPTVTVTLPSGEHVEGRLIRIDDFLVSIGMADGSTRTIAREDEATKVDVHDPMKGHKDLLSVYTDKDMHDVTAYLVTLK